MRIFEKNVVSKTEPCNRNVLWIDTKDNHLKFWGNNGWTTLTNDNEELVGIISSQLATINGQSLLNGGADINAISSADVVTPVTELPAVEDAVAGKIYCVKSENVEDGNAYDEYILVDGKFEKFGSFRADVDLSDVLTKDGGKLNTNGYILFPQYDDNDTKDNSQYVLVNSSSIIIHRDNSADQFPPIIINRTKMETAEEKGGITINFDGIYLTNGKGNNIGSDTVVFNTAGSTTDLSVYAKTADVTKTLESYVTKDDLSNVSVEYMNTAEVDDIWDSVTA